MIEARADFAASEGQRGDVALQVIPVFMEEELVVFQAAPALPPAIVGQNVQVACQWKQTLHESMYWSGFKPNELGGLWNSDHERKKKQYTSAASSWKC